VCGRLLRQGDFDAGFQRLIDVDADCSQVFGLLSENHRPIIADRRQSVHERKLS